MKLALPSPLQNLSISPHLEVFIKRDDLIHPWVSGNKYRKLKGYLEGKEIDKIITFGGPFSNHLHATAAYCYYHGISCKAIVRGLDADMENPTLEDISKWNAEIELISRSKYREKKHLFSEISTHQERAVLIPEGGWGEKGFLGMKELAEELMAQCPDLNFVVLPVGSATSLIGLSRHLPASVRLIGIRAVRDDSLDDKIKQYKSGSVQLIKGYEWNGFARYDQDLISYMDQKKRDFDIPLDFIYNAKALYALEDLIEQDFFEKGSRIIYLHTGGLQGNRGMDYKRKKNS